MEWTLVLMLYLVAAFSYNFAIWFSAGGLTRPDVQLFSLDAFLARAGIGYALKAVMTLPIWWLVFRAFPQFSWRRSALIHAIALPVFAIGFQVVSYEVKELLGYWHLGEEGRIWDIYIPGLFYVVQFGTFHTYYYFRQNEEKIRREAELKELALKSELSALKAQLNPHFLYNVFNTINASVPPEQESTRQMIAELSDLFRYQLRASQTDEVPLQEELAFIKKYLSLEKARFGNRLRIEIDIPEALYAQPVPPMILQPLVENAIKHGIAPLIEGGTVHISVRSEGEKLHFVVKDTGKGITDKARLFGSGVGLTNTQKRLQKMFGTELVFADNQPHGLKVSFWLKAA